MFKEYNDNYEVSIAPVKAKNIDNQYVYGRLLKDKRSGQIVGIIEWNHTENTYGDKYEIQLNTLDAWQLEA